VEEEKKEARLVDIEGRDVDALAREDKEKKNVVLV